MSAQTTRLQIVERIHVLLMHELGRGVDARSMLEHSRYARDVLLVCDACQGTELPLLALHYRELTRAAPAAAAEQPGGHARQSTEWSHTSTGFGLSRPLESVLPPTRPPQADPAPTPRSGTGPGWIARWLKP